MPEHATKGLDKITADDLRSFASEGKRKERRSVLVEISEPPLRLRPRPLNPSPPRAPKKSHKPDAPDLANIEGRKEEMDKLEQLLRDLDLHEAPVRLNAAQAFVVNVTAEQLRELAARAEVGFIRPNRQRRV